MKTLITCSYCLYYFSANFHFALVGHLLKGFRHPTPTTVSRTTRILTMLLGIIAKPHKRDKFEVTILLIEHDMKLVAGICEKITVLNFGTELACGTPDHVLNDPKVITAYLGE